MSSGDRKVELQQGTDQNGWIEGAWGRTGSARDATFYSLTRAGARAVTEQAERWRRLAGLVDELLLEN